MRSNLTPPKQPVTLEQLRHTSNCLQLTANTVPRVALEELALHRRARGLVSDLGKFFDNVSDYLDAKVAGFSDRKIDIKRSDIDVALSHVKYTDLSELLVPVIPGMSVNWLKMIEVMELAAAPASALYDKTLKPFSVFVAQILNDPDKLQSASLRPNIQLHDLSVTQTQLGRALANGHVDKLRYGKVFQRNAEVTQVSALLHAMIERHNRINTDMIIAAVKELDSNLELLMEKIQDPNQPYRMTPQKVQELSKICFALANEVTAYSVYTVTLEQAVNAVNGTIKLLEKNVK